MANGAKDSKKLPIIVAGPTAVGKSAFALKLAQQVDGEIVGADAYQIYQGLETLTGQPSPEMRRAVPHHLIGMVPLTEKRDAEQFRTAALEALADIRACGKPAFVVGGSGLYIKALTHGLSPLPKADERLRAELNEASTAELFARLQTLDPDTANEIDRQNKHRASSRPGDLPADRPPGFDPAGAARAAAAARGGAGFPRPRGALRANQCTSGKDVCERGGRRSTGRRRDRPDGGPDARSAPDPGADRRPHLACGSYPQIRRPRVAMPKDN